MDIGSVIKKFDIAINDPKTYKDVFKTNSEDAYDQIDKIEGIRFKAIAGDMEAERFMIEKLCKFIYLHSDADYTEIIDFKDLLKNPPDVKLILLLEVDELYLIIDKYETDHMLDNKTLEAVFSDDIDKIRDKYANLKERTEIIAKVIFSNVYGLGIVDFLRGRFINEIGVLRKDFVYVISRGRKTRIEAAGTLSTGALQNILKKATLGSNTPFDKANPISISSRKNTDRIAVAGFDVAPDENELYMNIRIFNLENISLEELRDKYFTLNDEILKFLEINQKGKGSFFITGADMNVGKSTLLLAMLQKLPDSYGIGIIDPQNEMRIGMKYPDKNTITLISNEQKSTDECFEYLLKTSRDIIAVSEITNSNEATQLINGALRLNCGICATMHSLNPSEVVTNLRNLMMRTDMYTNGEVASDDIRRGIDLIIHLKRIKDRIVIDSIDEITARGLNRLFEYSAGSWNKLGRPSERYLKKISCCLDNDDMETYERIFGETDAHI
jgi:type IV secretory pathway ATPase VirB11/archaellum biosynthesis ATPase